MNINPLQQELLELLPDVYRDGQRLEIPAALIDLVGDIAIPRFEPHITGDGSVIMKQTEEGLLRLAESHPSAGLLPSLACKARESGVNWDHKGCDRSINTLPEPIDNFFVHPGLSHFVRAQPRGLIRIHPGASAVFVVAGIATAYPLARIILLFTHRRELRPFKKSLAKISPELARRLNLPEGAGEIRCCLWFQAADVEFPLYDLAIVPQAANILHRNGTIAMRQADARFRLFGIENFGERPSPRESALLMAAYGPAVYEIPANGAETALVQFAWITSRPESLPGDLRGLELHRPGYWRNRVRNRRIARTASVLHAGNPGGIKLDPQIDQWLRLHGKAEMHVVVHCACVEQFLAIKAHLPNAKISTALTVDALSRLSRHQRDEITSHRADGSGGLVLTDGETACRRTDVDVVIWASGGSGILTGPLSSSLPNRRPVLIIDYRDCHHRQLFRWSERRFLQYMERGWFPVGCDESLSRVVFFQMQYPTIGGRR